MITIYGNQYRTIFLDTNAIREISTNSNSALRFFIEQQVRKKVPAIVTSIYNILELKGQGDKFDSFLEFFDKWPMVLFWDPGILFNQEHFAATHNSVVDWTTPNLISAHIPSWVDNTQFSLQDELRSAEMQELYDYNETQLSEYEQTAIVWQAERNAQLINDKEYFKEIETCRLIESLKNFTGDKTICKIEKQKYPAHRISLYSHYTRIHQTRKPIQVNDVIDVMASSFMAYADIIITEKFQADTLRKAKKFITGFKPESILVLSDIR